MAKTNAKTTKTTKTAKTVKAAHTLTHDSARVPDAGLFSFAVVVADWHEDITSALLSGCLKTLKRHKADLVEVFRVPGSFELTTMAGKLASTGDFDAIICLGCVIQGETRHFEFICQAVANGLTNVGIQFGLPVIFGVLTTNTLEQAKARSGGALGNKGTEAAVAAIQMANTFFQIEDDDPVF